MKWCMDAKRHEHRGECGVEDTRRALIEAKSSGAHTRSIPAGACAPGESDLTRPLRLLVRGVFNKPAELHQQLR